MPVEDNPLVGVVDARCDSPDHRDEIYRMVGYCSNCTARLLGLFTVTHETSHYGPCPVCGVYYRLNWQRLATPDEIPAAVGAA